MMIVLVLIIVVGLAFVINRFLVNNIENKTQRIGLNIVSYALCVLFGIIFIFVGSLRTVLDKFIVGRIVAIEATLSQTFPDMDILHHGIDTNEFVLISDELQKVVSFVDTSGDSVLEKLVYSAFLGRLTDYVSKAKDGMDTMIEATDADGKITINSILFHLKDTALNAVSPYFVTLQTIIIVLFIISLGIYIGIIFYIKKGGGAKNKSITYG